MAIFTAIAGAIGIAAGFWTAAFVTVASIATSIGISYLTKALAGDPKGTSPNNAISGVQGTLQSGADIPRSFNVGYSVTAGSLVYANTWGEIQPGGSPLTPNAYLTMVIALEDLPGSTFIRPWVNGEPCSLEGGLDDMGRGYPVAEYRKEGQPYLWVKYYDGTQTVADPFLVGTVASTDRPYESTRVGKGISYVIVTCLVNDKLFSGFPQFRFELSGIKLYDPTKDSTNGGTGPQRWSNPATWGGDGDSLPVVQAYNILRGIYYDGAWLYGLQRMTASRLPAVNWNAQIAKCRATITGVSGPEATYRTGGQVSIGTPPVNIIEALLSGCQGRLSEIGGFYKIHVGAPESPSFEFSDDDILSTEEQHFSPFFGLSDSVNGIAATYPAPEEGWNMKPAPPLFNEDYEEQDGDRRLLANPVLDFVPYAAQVQRLQKSALQEARRARRHDITLPPMFWICEPGDVVEWTSARNGYDAKQFRIDGIVDKANLDVQFNLTEVDPTDYDWDHDNDYVPITAGPTVITRPTPQGVIDWFVEGAIIYDNDGSPRRPAIRITWDGTLPGVTGITYQCRLAGETELVTSGNTDQIEAGALIFSQSLLPDTDYEVRGQYIPSSPRDMLWSDWLDVTTPDVRLTLADFSDALKDIVTGIEDSNNEQIDKAVNLLSSLIKNEIARNWLDKKQQRTELEAVAGGARAAISTLQEVIADNELAFAQYQIEVSATFGPSFSTVTTVSAAVATLDGYAAGSWGVEIDVNGNVVGLMLVNSSDNVSAFTVTVDKFQIAAPGVFGGAAVPIFTVANVNGTPKVALRADMYVDGSITAQQLNVAYLTAISAHFGSAVVDGDLTASNGKLVLDFDDGFLDIYD